MLEIKNISASYRQGFGIEDITFGAAPARLTGVIGPNGSGKTTLLRVLCGELPGAGAALLNGEDLLKMSLQQRSRLVAEVPQSIEKLPISVYDYALTGRTPYRRWWQLDYSETDRAIADEALAEAGLSRLYSPEVLKKKKVGEMSGGERQLAALAKALCQQPQVLLLDEPTASLDFANQIQTLDKIKELTEKSHCHTLLVIHDVNLAAAYCSHLVFLSQGRIVCQGPVEEVFTKENLEKFYGTEVSMTQHPLTKKPVVLPAK